MKARRAGLPTLVLYDPTNGTHVNKSNTNCTFRFCRAVERQGRLRESRGIFNGVLKRDFAFTMVRVAEANGMLVWYYPGYPKPGYFLETKMRAKRKKGRLIAYLHVRNVEPLKDSIFVYLAYQHAVDDNEIFGHGFVNAEDYKTLERLLRAWGAKILIAKSEHGYDRSYYPPEKFFEMEPKLDEDYAKELLYWANHARETKARRKERRLREKTSRRQK